MSHLPPSGTLQVHHDAAASCFEAWVDGLQCVASYRLDGALMTLHHTGVPRALEGQGIAAQLVAAALAHARSQGWTVRPTCSYVAAYMRRHPDTQDLLAP
jgi:uncharacterized protein